MTTADNWPIHYRQKTNGRITHENVKYGQIVLHQHFFCNKPNGIYCSAKVHFFKRKGVLVGHDYLFVPYDHIAQHERGYDVWERLYLNKRFETLRQWVYEKTCRLTSALLRWTQKQQGNG